MMKGKEIWYFDNRPFNMYTRWPLNTVPFNTVSTIFYRALNGKAFVRAQVAHGAGA